MNDSIAAVYARRTIEMKMREYGCFMAASPEVFLRSPSEAIDAIADPLNRHVTIGVRLRFPAQLLASLRKPIDWRQVVKERFAPEWAKRRWPVLYDQIDVQQCLDVAVPSGQSVFVVEVNGKPQYGHGLYKRAGYCGVCSGPVPVFMERDGMRLNPLVTDVGDRDA